MDDSAFRHAGTAFLQRASEHFSHNSRIITRLNIYWLHSPHHNVFSLRMTGAHGGVEESFHNSLASAKLLKNNKTTNNTKKHFLIESCFDAKKGGHSGHTHDSGHFAFLTKKAGGRLTIPQFMDFPCQSVLLELCRYWKNVIFFVILIFTFYS